MREIVEEGEGATGFEATAIAFLQVIEQLPQGARSYLQALMTDQNPQSTAPTPPWLNTGEFLRQSHLYRFAMVLTEYNRELELANMAKMKFQPARASTVGQDIPALQRIAVELPLQFNAAYLVLLMWLSRMYEIPDWLADKPRRQAIEMLASWPLMSMAIRPLLELASLVPVDASALFSVDGQSLPLLPLHARELLELYEANERSEAINERMDYLAVRVLRDVAAWATTKISDVESVPLTGVPDYAQTMILTRLREISLLDEFEKQFPYRVHGGYSDREPDITFQQSEPESAKFEENPATLDTLYQDAFVLRLRFSGWGLVQLATDPDPSFDEAGCTGTHMLHAADGELTFDRALVWQPECGKAIIREPREKLPPLGVTCSDITLMLTDGGSTAGYVPLQVMNSSGAVQASGVQQKMDVQGLSGLVTLSPQELGTDPIKMNLLTKGTDVPCLQGLNHLMWQDGEPIDPFILSVSVGEQPLFAREIYNEGLSMKQMSPLERLISARGPCGFDSVANIPQWAMGALSESQQNLLQGPGYPRNYLNQRANDLVKALSMALAEGTPTQSTVDTAVSLAERIALISAPRGTTVAWLTILLHYGHTISGAVSPLAETNAVFSALQEKCGFALTLSDIEDRSQANSRWLASYTLGIMDTDVVSNLVYGELFIPLAVQSPGETITLSKTWEFAAAFRDAIAQYACRFDEPFWGAYQVEGETRSFEFAPTVRVTERLNGSPTAESYTYEAVGFPDLAQFHSSLGISPSPEDQSKVVLKWKVEFQANTPLAVVEISQYFVQTAQDMMQQLTSYMTPQDAA